MRRRTAAVGALLLVVAVYLYFNPSLTAPVSNSLGQMSTDNVYSYNSVVRVAPENFSYYPANLTSGDTLVVSLTSNPGNIDVLLMNQGNYSLWSSGNGVSFSTYPESALKVSNYSFSFTNNEKTQTFFIVFVSHSTASTAVLLNTAATKPSEESILLVPFLVGFVGLVVLTVAFRGGGTKDEGEEDERTQQQTAQVSQAAPQVPNCRHCGAVLEPGNQFCPSCHKSQL